MVSMQEYRFSFVRLQLAVLVLALLPAALAGQVREVVSNQLAISQREAALVLEFTDDGVLEITLRDGVVSVDDEEVGRFAPGDALDTAWRGLLGEIVTLTDGPLGQALQDWAPPASLSGDALDTAELLDESLETALRPRESSTQADPEPGIDLEVPSDLGLRALLSRTEILGELGEALEAIDALTSSIYVREDVRVARDEVVHGPIVVAEGQLTVDGTIDGDVFIVEGSITVNDGAEIHGDIRLVNSRYDGVPESSLAGRVMRVDFDDLDLQTSDLAELQDLEARVRNEVREELRDEIRDELHKEFSGTPRGGSAWGAVSRGIAEIIGDLITFLILSLIALGVVYFAKDNLEVVADTAGQDPVRAGMVGVAGTFLVLPAWLAGCVALAVSIVGIIALPFWLVLFPLAVALGATLGYLAVARNIGEWLAAKEISRTEWLRPTNTFYAVAMGVGAILAFSVAAHALDIVPFFGLLSKLVAVLGSMIALAAVLIGFGAVLLTRGGRQPEFYGGGDLLDREPVWAEESYEGSYSDDVIEAEEDTKGRAEAVADVADDDSGEAAEARDVDNE